MLKARILLKTDTSEAWRINNPILLDGESGYESDTNLIKVGDGVHHWKDLKYANAGATAVASTANYAKNALNIRSGRNHRDGERTIWLQT